MFLLCSPDHMLYKTAFAVDLLNISSLQQPLPTYQEQRDRGIGCNVKFNLETNPYSNGPKVKVNLTAGAY